MKFTELEIHAQRCLEQNKPLQVLIDMPGFEAPELIVNPPENIQKKVEYYAATYDENCQHKHAKGIAIVDVVCGLDISLTQESFTAATTHQGELILPSSALTEGHVRYSCATYVGEQSKDISVEGAVDDVLKVLGTLD